MDIFNLLIIKNNVVYTQTWITSYLWKLNEVKSNSWLLNSNNIIIKIQPGYRYESLTWSWIVSPIIMNKSLFYNEFEKNVPLLIEYWNNDTVKIGNEINHCDNVIKKINMISDINSWTWNIYLQNNWFEIFISKENIKSIFACYIKEKHYVNTQINTDYATYRKINVWLALDQFNNTVIKHGWKIKAYGKIFKPWLKYVDWLWVKIIDWKPESFWVNGWGVCWVSTILYQNSLKTFGMNVESRINHSNYYKIYYWPIVWLDSTIFWFWKTPTRDLVVKNNVWINVYITTYNFKDKSWKKFSYWVNFFAPFVQKNKISSDTYKDKKGCIINTITKADWISYETKSCYKNIY